MLTIKKEKHFFFNHILVLRNIRQRVNLRFLFLKERGKIYEIYKKKNVLSPLE